MNYSAYKMPDTCGITVRWYVFETVKIMILGALIGWLFYDSLLGGISVFFAAPYIIIRDKKRYLSERKKLLRDAFRNMIIILAGNLNAGYSVENAFVRVLDEADRRGNRDKHDIIINEWLRYIVNGIRCNQRLEDMLLDVGAKSGVREVEEFAGLIVLAKQYGGNVIQMISQSAGNMSDTQLVEREIHTMVSAKRLEGRIMMVTPFAILFYMRCTNRAFLEVMYTSLMGVIIISICLAVMVAAWLWTDKIIRIEV